MTSHAQPRQPQQQYAPHPSMQQPAAPPRPGRILATLAVSAAGVELLVGIALMIAQVLLIRTESFSLIGGIAAVGAGLGLVLAVLAIVFGAVSIARREQARMLAGVAIGVGIAAIVSTLTGLLQGALLSVI